jgi:hypothetical protein
MLALCSRAAVRRRPPSSSKPAEMRVFYSGTDTFIAITLALPDPSVETPVASSQPGIFPLLITVKNNGWLPMTDVNVAPVPTKMIFQNGVTLKMRGAFSTVRGEATIPRIGRSQSSGSSIRKLITLRQTGPDTYINCIEFANRGSIPDCVEMGKKYIKHVPWSQQIGSVPEVAVANMEIAVTVRYRCYICAL